MNIYAKANLWVIYNVGKKNNFLKGAVSQLGINLLIRYHLNINRNSKDLGQNTSTL